MIYTKKLDQMVAFYTTMFGYEVVRLEGDHIVELRPQGNGTIILLHPIAKGQKEGQCLIRLVFDVEGVAGFREICRHKGFDFGPLHEAQGYQFANAKDPSNNSVSISSRAFLRAES